MIIWAVLKDIGILIAPSRIICLGGMHEAKAGIFVASVRDGESGVFADIDEAETFLVHQLRKSIRSFTPLTVEHSPADQAAKCDEAKP